MKFLSKPLSTLLRSGPSAGLAAGCLASLALHAGLFTVATWHGDSLVFGGWNGSGSSDSGDGEPSFTIHVRVGRGDGAQEALVIDAQALAQEPITEPAAPERAPDSEDAPEAPLIVAEIPPQANANDPVDSSPVIPAYSEQTSEPTPPAQRVSSPLATDASAAGLAVTTSAATPSDSTGSASSEAATRSGASNGEADGDAAKSGGGVPGTAADGIDQRPVHAPKPSYPSISRRLGEEGKVYVRITIARDGRVLAVELARSSGHPRLDRAAIESIQRWRFTPTKSRDARASVTIQHCVTFRLE